VASAEHSRVEPSAGPLLATPLRDLEDRAVVLKSLIEPKNPPLGDGGKVLVVLHQDRKSGEQNQDFKDQLGKLTTLPGGRERLHIVALADVGGYDFWPAKGYVKEALRPVQAAGGALVLCDWKGAVRKHYAIRPGQSAVFVVDGAGELRTFRQGLLAGDDASQLLQLIKSLLATPGGS
jgi:hypothetical protein